MLGRLFNKLLPFILCLGWSLLPSTSNAQKYNFRNYNVQDGLLQSQVNCMIQDSRGYLWLGTWEGLSRFDGRAFKNYTIKDGLPGLHIEQMLEDKEGNIWLATKGGISKFNGIGFENFPEVKGLLEVNISRIFEDSRGNIWFLTHGNGIIKYNPAASLNTGGVAFEHFTTQDGVNDNYMYLVCEDKHGNIWFGSRGTPYAEVSDGGVSVFNGKEFVSINAKNGLLHNTVQCLLPISNGDVWVGGGNGAVKFSPSLKNPFYGLETFPNTYLFAPFYESDTLASITNMFEDNNQDVWLCSWSAGHKTPLIISKYSERTKSTQFFLGTEMEKFPNIVRHIVEDHNQNIFFFISAVEGENQILRYNPNASDNSTTIINNTTVNLLEKFTPLSGFHNSEMRAKPVIDKENNLWFGHDGAGVTVLNSLKFSIYNTNHGLSDNSIWSVMEDSEGNMWMGTNSGGACKLASNTIEIYDESSGMHNDFVASIIEDNDKNIWFGNNRGVTKFNRKNLEVIFSSEGQSFEKAFSYGGIWAMLQDSRGYIWFGTYNKGLKQYNPVTSKLNIYTEENGLAEDHVWNIFEDSKGRIWVATGGGISVFEYEATDQGIGKFTAKYTQEDGLTNDNVYSIAEDRSGNFWFSTKAGLCRFRSVMKGELKGKFTCYTQDDGLASDVSYFVIHDDAGYLWIGTSKGVDRIKLDANGDIENVKHYGMQEGFMGVEAGQNAVCKDSKGNLWFGTVNGVMKYNPKEDRMNTIEPITHITNIKLFLKDIEWESQRENWCDSISGWHGLPVNLSLPYNKNHLTFEFTAISLTIPEKVKYRYKLEPFDKEWVSEVFGHVRSEYLSSQAYSNLNPGNYIFKVMACNNDGVWNKEPTVYTFTITPPYWETGWFYSLQLLFFMTLIGGTMIVSRRGKSARMVTILVYISLFVIFEFIQNLTEPIYEEFVGSAPIIKTLLNLILASTLLPVQLFLRKYLRGKARPVKTEDELL